MGMDCKADRTRHWFWKPLGTSKTALVTKLLQRYMELTKFLGDAKKAVGEDYVLKEFGIR